MPQDAIDDIWVYRANTSGFPANSYYVSTESEQHHGASADAMLAAGCTTACVRYRWNDRRGTGSSTSPGGWDYEGSTRASPILTPLGCI